MNEHLPESTDIVVAPESSPNLLPELAGSLDQINSSMESFRSFVRSNLVKDEDYGVIPGTGSKPTLLKPGAEKMLTYHGFAWEVEEIEAVFQHDPPVVRYVYEGKAVDRRSGCVVVAGVQGEANSYEDRYHWRWVTPNKMTPSQRQDKENLQTRSRSSRGESYTQYRVPSEASTILGLSNTIRKIAQKRCVVALALASCRASGSFTQDLEDMPSVAAKGANGNGAGGSANWRENPISGKQKGLLQHLCEDASIDGNALNVYCQSHFSKAYAEPVADKAAADVHRKAGRLLSENNDWAFVLTQAEASKLIDAVKGGMVGAVDAEVE